MSIKLITASKSIQKVFVEFLTADLSEISSYADYKKVVTAKFQHVDGGFCEELRGFATENLVAGDFLWDPAYSEESVALFIACFEKFLITLQQEITGFGMKNAPCDDGRFEKVNRIPYGSTGKGRTPHINYSCLYK